MILEEALEEEAGCQGLGLVCGGGYLQPLKEPRRRCWLVFLGGQAGSERASQPMRVWNCGEASLVSVSKVWPLNPALPAGTFGLFQEVQAAL